MIRDEVQYRNTQQLLAGFEAAAAELEGTAADAGRPRLRKTQIAAVRSQADSLREELAGYERLRSGEHPAQTRR